MMPVAGEIFHIADIVFCPGAVFAGAARACKRDVCAVESIKAIRLQQALLIQLKLCPVPNPDVNTVNRDTRSGSEPWSA